MQRRILFSVLFCCTCLFSFSQTEKWQVYPAYTEAVQVEVAGDYLYCVMKGSGTVGSTTGNLVRYDTEDGSVKTYDCMHELHDKEVMYVSYNNSVGRLVVIYENGNIDIVGADDTVINQSALKDKSVTGSSINCINHFGDVAYLCTSDLVIKLDVREGIILDTYKVGQRVHGIFFIEDKIYVALDHGISALDHEEQLVNPRSWEHVCDVEIEKIAEFAGTLYVITPGEQLYYVLFEAGTLRSVKSGYSFSEFFPSEQNLLCLNYGDWLGLFNEERPTSPVVFKQEHDWMDAGFAHDRLYAVDKSGRLVEYVYDGVIKKFIPQTDDSILKINSPKRDFFYRMQYMNGRLLVAGGVNPIEPAYYPVTFMYMEPDGRWVNFDETQATAEFPRMNNINALNLVQDPLDERHFYGAVWRNGLHEYYMNDDGYLELKNFFNYYNSPIKNIDVPVNDPWNYTTCTALQYDVKGNLWLANQHTDTIIRFIRPDGKWMSLFYPDIAETTNVFQYLFSSHDINFLVSYQGDKSGFFGFDTNGTLNYPEDDRHLLRSVITNQDGTTVMPTQFYCLTEDKDREIWCGTNEGLFVITSPQDWFNDDFRFHQIKRNRNDGSGYADYLLAGVDITCIAVDASNRKWIGTLNNGVYLLSPDGQETIYHFTKETSPLLSNYIYSIAINPQNGFVMIGTDMGLCSYAEQVTETEEDLLNENVIVYPNPVRPSVDSSVTISGLTDGTEVKILTSSGKNVWMNRSIGGSVRWNCCDMSGKRVSSGVYHVVCNTVDAGKTVVSRIIVIN